jgi:hypothetical protein
MPSSPIAIVAAAADADENSVSSIEEVNKLCWPRSHRQVAFSRFRVPVIQSPPFMLFLIGYEWMDGTAKKRLKKGGNEWKREYWHL